MAFSLIHIKRHKALTCEWPRQQLMYVESLPSQQLSSHRCFGGSLTSHLFAQSLSLWRQSALGRFTPYWIVARNTDKPVTGPSRHKSLYISHLRHINWTQMVPISITENTRTNWLDLCWTKSVSLKGWNGYLLINWHYFVEICFHLWKVVFCNLSKKQIVLTMISLVNSIKGKNIQWGKYLL